MISGIKLHVVRKIGIILSAGANSKHFQTGFCVSAFVAPITLTDGDISVRGVQIVVGVDTAVVGFLSVIKEVIISPINRSRRAIGNEFKADTGKVEGIIVIRLSRTAKGEA